MLLRKSCNVLLNILAVYFYFTGMFKIKKYKEHKTKEGYPKKYDKLIFIVIDGLRIDGTVKTDLNTKYHNNFRFTNSLASENIKYFLTVADIPTSTSVRIKSILTGLPSNFLNGAESFSHDIIKTDSFIHKIIDKSHYFYGDDTWISFFPELIAKSQTIPAYGKDRAYDTEKKLIDQITNSVNQYDFLIAHLVYLDHYGHIHTTDSDQVSFIMKVYDKMIEDIYNKMDDTTLLVIISDHGVNNDGSHGGASRDETSATGMFISKKEIKMHENIMLDEIRNNYMKTKYNSGLDWIKSYVPIKIISQNDVLPTMCALMGLSIPFYSTGNFIHEFINDISSHYSFLKQKCDVLEKQIPECKDITEIMTESYKASKQICWEYSGQSMPKIILALILILISLIMQLRNTGFLSFLRVSDISIIITMIMISHSVWSFIYEDLFWCITLLMNNLNVLTLFLSLYSIIIGRSPKENEPRFIDVKKPSQTFDNKFFLPLLFIVSHLSCLQPILKKSKKSKKTRKLRNYIYKNIMTYHNLILGIKYFAPSFFNDNKLALLMTQLSFRNLATILYPVPTVIALDLFKQASAINENICFILTNMSLFVIQMNHMLSSIDYGIPFTFDNLFHMKIGSFLMFFYYIYFRWSIMYKKISDRFLFFSTIHALLNMIIGIWFYEEFLFYVVFGGRVFIVNFFFVCENLIYLLNV